MKHFLIAVSALIAGCAGTSNVKIQSIPELQFEDRNKVIASEVDSRGAIVYSLDSGKKIQIQKTENLSPAEAKTAIARKQALLRRYLEQQVDPYIGAIPIAPYCKRESHASSSASEISSTHYLGATENMLLTCSTASPHFYVEYQLLYCTQSRALFEIKAFTPSALRASQEFKLKCQ